MYIKLSSLRNPLAKEEKEEKNPDPPFRFFGGEEKP
jgi:hypothetical protein